MAFYINHNEDHSKVSYTRGDKKINHLYKTFMGDNQRKKSEYTIYHDIYLKA